jgi:hypothetical protein
MKGSAWIASWALSVTESSAKVCGLTSPIFFCTP